MRTPGGQGVESKTDSATIGEQGADSRALARLRAVAALNGMSVFDLPDGSLLVTRWGLARAVPGVRALSLFFQRMGVTA